MVCGLGVWSIREQVSVQGAWQFPVSVSHPSRAAGTEQTMYHAKGWPRPSPVTAQVGCGTEVGGGEVKVQEWCG